MNNSLKFVCASLALSASFLLGCGGSNVCLAGSAGCVCTTQSTCNDGLSCNASNQCVANDASGGSVGSGGGSGSTTSTGGDGSGNTTSSGGDTGTGAITGSGGVVSTGGVTSSGGVTASGGVTGTGGATTGCAAGTSQGSCGLGNSQVCSGGEWVPDPACGACSATNFSSYCDHVWVFALDSTYAAIDGAVTNATYSASGVSATFNLAAGDTGFVQFKLSSALSPSEVAVSALGSGPVSVSLENGAMGCQYTLSGGYLDFDPITGSDGCWEGMQPMGWDELNGVEANYPSGPATALNVRVTGSGSVTLNVSSAYFY